MRIQAVIALLILLTSFSGSMNAQTSVNQTEAQTRMSNIQTLDAKQQSLITLSALTTKGDLGNLWTALNQGLDAGLTVNETKEVLVQLYAYCGFPRSLNGINTLMSVLEDRKKRGVTDEEGKRRRRLPTAINTSVAGRHWRRSPGSPNPVPPKGSVRSLPRLTAF